MSRRRWVLLALLALALAGQSVRAYQRLLASRVTGEARLQLAATSRPPVALVRAAEAAFARAARLDPVSVEPRTFAGDLSLLLGRHHAAIERYREAARHELRPETLLHWGLALERVGDHDGAVRQWRRAVVLAPRFLEAVPAGFRKEVRAAPIAPWPAANDEEAPGGEPSARPTVLIPPAS